MNIGDIHWIQLPATGGREQTGHRPAVIVQDETYAGNLPLVLIIPLTTATAALRFAGTLMINPTVSNGLKQASVALVFQLRAVDRSRIKDKIGTVSDEVMSKIFATLDRLMGRS
ncbi:type II toxin-antitoxin system PemK/MazF family toxin [bacterium]|nr:type II toxin-antitoxin system PemK/MazF family toxin [bacterium]